MSDTTISTSHTSTVFTDENTTAEQRHGLDLLRKEVIAELKMLKPNDVKPTWNKGQYIASIGYRQTEDGQRKAKVFYLGTDERRAKLLKAALQFMWQKVERMDGRGVAVWFDAAVAIAEEAVLFTLRDVYGVIENVAKQFASIRGYVRLATTNISIDANANSSKAGASKGQAGLFTVMKAIDAYGVKLNADVMSGERSQSNATRLMTSLKQFSRFVADQPYDPDADKHLPKNEEKQAEYFSQKFAEPSPAMLNRGMTSIGYDQISSFVTTMKNRRVSQFMPITIKDGCKHVGSWLEWLEESGQWKASCNYTKLLKFKTGKLYTPAELRKKAKGQDTFTPDELAMIYAYGNEQQRLYLMLGLNICGTQQQLADLMNEDAHLDADQPYVEFVTGKTRHSANNGQGIEVRYDLWSLTARLLAARMKTTPANKEGLALLTENGKALVRFDGKKRSRIDTIKLTWQKLVGSKKNPQEGIINREKQQVRPLGFKFLRKTIATMVKNLTDEATQQQCLAQSSQTVAGRHYTGASDFTKMNKAMKTIWSQLEPTFLAAAEKVEQEDQAAKAERRQAYLARQKASKAARRQAKRQEAALVKA